MVRLASLPPSAFMTKMSSVDAGDLALEHDLRVHSGEKLGLMSMVVLPGVRLVGLDPSMFIVKMSMSPPSRLLWKAILVPSGETRSGSGRSVGLPPVRLTAFEPSAFMMKTSLSPPSARAKTILVPSGVNVAWLPTWLRGVGAPPLAPIENRLPADP